MGMVSAHNTNCLIHGFSVHMFGSSSRTEPRKDPSWTQAPLSHGRSEPVWRDAGAAQAYEPTQQQTAAPRKSSTRVWISAVLAVVGLLAVAYLLLSMFNVVQEQMARNQPEVVQSSAGR